MSWLKFLVLLFPVLFCSSLLMCHVWLFTSSCCRFPPFFPSTCVSVVRSILFFYPLFLLLLSLWALSLLCSSCSSRSYLLSHSLLGLVFYRFTGLYSQVCPCLLLPFLLPFVAIFCAWTFYFVSIGLYSFIFIKAHFLFLTLLASRVSCIWVLTFFTTCNK